MRHITARIATGSGILARRIGQALIPEGRPVAAATRVIGGGFVATAALNAAHQAPPIVPVLLAVWCRRAWLAGQPAPPDPNVWRRQLAEGVLELIGDRPGIHLAELYPALLARPAAAHLDEARLRAALLDAGITITRSLRVGDVEGRSGIRRADVEAALRSLSPSPSPAPSPADGEPGQAASESGGERAGERLESA